MSADGLRRAQIDHRVAQKAMRKYHRKPADRAVRLLLVERLAEARVALDNASAARQLFHRKPKEFAEVEGAILMISRGLCMFGMHWLRDHGAKLEDHPALDATTVTFGCECCNNVTLLNRRARLRGLRSMSTPGELFISLHTADPNEVHPSEVTYESYARVPTKLQAVGNEIGIGDVDFPVVNGGAGTVTHFGIYDSRDGGTLLLAGPISPTIVLGAGVTARISTTFEEA